MPSTKPRFVGGYNGVNSFFWGGSGLWGVMSNHAHILLSVYEYGISLAEIARHLGGRSMP
jgi:hypothetical protein